MGWFAAAAAIGSSLLGARQKSKGTRAFDNVGQRAIEDLETTFGDVRSSLEPFLEGARGRSNLVAPGISSLLSELIQPQQQGLDPSTISAIDQQTRDLSNQFAARGLSRSGELIEELTKRNTDLIARREPALREQRARTIGNTLRTLVPFLEEERALTGQLGELDLDKTKTIASLKTNQDRARATGAQQRANIRGDIFGGIAKGLGSLL